MRFKPEKKNEEESGSNKNRAVRPCMCVSAIDSLLFDPFWVIKGKEKKQIIYLYIKVVVFLCYTTYIYIFIQFYVKVFRLHIDMNGYGGARGVIVIIVGNGHGDTSSNLERD